MVELGLWVLVLGLIVLGWLWIVAAVLGRLERHVKAKRKWGERNKLRVNGEDSLNG